MVIQAGIIYAALKYINLSSPARDRYHNWTGKNMISAIHFVGYSNKVFSQIIETAWT